jgi:5'-nucleotidase
MVPRERVIVITNDDGIHSVGIAAAADAVCNLGKVIIVAPSTQKSGVGRSLSLFEPIRVSKARVNNHEAYAIGGTPTDAVLIAEYAILKRKPDLLISGINIGENVSTESVMTSGTVGAALEGASQKIPSIAVSVQARDIDIFEPRAEIEFTLAKTVLRTVSAHVLMNGMPKKVDVLNINIPMNKGEANYKTTKLARNVFDIRILERFDPRGYAYFWIDSDFLTNHDTDTDVYALKQGFVSVTPISIDNTADVDREELMKWLKFSFSS